MEFNRRTSPFIALVAIMLMSFTPVHVDVYLTKKDVMVASWERAKTYTKEYLDAAPEDVYGFKPTPEIRSFAEQMHHLAVDNYKIVKAAVSGITTFSNYKDLEKQSLKSKVEITNAVLESYDFVIETIKKIDEAELTNTVKMFNKWETTVEDGLDKAFEHQTHHRGQTTIYLRLKGIVPPPEKLF